METQRKNRVMGSERTGINRRKSNRERKMALLQDVHISISLVSSVIDAVLLFKYFEIYWFDLLVYFEIPRLIS